MHLCAFNGDSLGDLGGDSVGLLLEVGQDTLVLVTVGLGVTQDVVIVAAGVGLKTVNAFGTRSVELGVLDAVHGDMVGVGLAVLNGVSSVARVDESLETGTLARVGLHDLLVLIESSDHLVVADVVEEDTVTHGVDGDGSAELAITGLEDSGGGLLEERTIEIRVVHGETGAGEEVQETPVLLGGKKTADVSESGRVGHVDGDSMAVAERSLGNELVKRRPGVTVGNNTVEHDLVKVWCLKLKHLVNTSTADLISNLLNLRRSIIRSTEASVDELLAVLLKKIIGVFVGTSRDLDQLSKSISDLSNWETAEECEVKEGVRGSVVGSETVLVAAVVDGDLDRDGSVNETNDCGGDADVVCVAAVSSTSKASNVSDETTTDNKDRLLAVDTKVGHGVDNGKESIHGLGLFTNHGLVDSKRDAIVVKVLLHLVTVEVEDVEVHDSQASSPGGVELVQLGVGGVEDAIEKLKVILDLLITTNSETLGGGLDGSGHIRHGGRREW